MRTAFLAVCALVCGCTNGRDGSPGAPGLNGEAGAPDSVVQSIYCTGSANLNMAEQYIAFETETNSDGSVFASALVANASYQSSASLLFAPGQQGYDTTPLHVVLDVDAIPNYGAWSLSLNRTTAVLSVVYTDPDLMQPYTNSFPPSFCTVKTYGADQ
jgi:hypothetical protein